MAEVLTQDSSSRVPDILRRTSPWVRLFGILMFVSSSFMVIGGLLFGLLGSRLVGGVEDGPGPVMPATIGSIFYAVFGAINFIPATFLMRFAVRAKEFAAANRPELLEQALDAQRSYWKFMGILMIVGVCAGVLVFGLAAVAGLMFWRAR